MTPDIGETAGMGEKASALAALPPLREALAAEGLLADKRLGQHFLFDLNLTRKIAGLTGPLAGQTVIEVGPGPGGLTRALLEAGARVIAVERDARFLPLLHAIAEAAGGRLAVVHGDALKTDDAALMETHAPGVPAATRRVVANLPYNIATPLLIRWLTTEPPPQAMALMFQREVAERIVARAGDDAYGRLSVLVEATAAARLALSAPARAFTPPPKVESAVVTFTPRADRPDASRLARMERVTAAAFGQRRKMLRASLKALGGEALCRAADVAPDARAETVDVAGFLRLADALAS